MLNKIISLVTILAIFSSVTLSQDWQNVTDSFGALPKTINVFRTDKLFKNRPFIAYMAVVDMSDRAISLNTDTSSGRRLTPQAFFEKNDQPFIVVNGTFFDFATNRNLNAVVKNGKLVSFNVHDQAMKGKDSIWVWHTTRSAIGIYKNRTADVAWLYTDSSAKKAKAFQQIPKPWKDSSLSHELAVWEKQYAQQSATWKVETAIAGGPVLVQDGKTSISNNEERMFTGKAIQDLHPRTAMGYTKDGKLLILAVEGRNPKIAEGASLTDLSELFLQWGAIEALNLDGGGSSCLLINGKQTIKPSDKEGERAVPAVFIVSKK